MLSNHPNASAAKTTPTKKTTSPDDTTPKKRAQKRPRTQEVFDPDAIDDEDYLLYAGNGVDLSAKTYDLECEDHHHKLEVPRKPNHDADELEQDPKFVFDMYSRQLLLPDDYLADGIQCALRFSYNWARTYPM